MRIYDFKRKPEIDGAEQIPLTVGDGTTGYTDISQLYEGIEGLRSPTPGFVKANKTIDTFHVNSAGGRRQAIWQAPKDFLEASGLNISLNGPMSISIADGWDEGGDVNYLHEINSVTDAWTVPDNATSYLWMEHTGENQVTFGSTNTYPEHDFFDNAPRHGPDIISSATITTASNFGAGYEPVLMKDGSMTTWWLSRSQSQLTNREWVQLDWGQTREIRHLRFFIGSNHSFDTWGGLPYSLRYETSADGVHWEEISEYVLDSRNQWGGAYPCLWWLPAHTSQPYSRIVAAGETSTGWWQIYELNAFEADYPEGHHYFSPRTMKMRVYEGGVTSFKPRIFVGEVTASGGQLTLKPYALNGQTEIFTNTCSYASFDVPHNLGCKPLRAKVWMQAAGELSQQWTGAETQNRLGNWDVANNRPEPYAYGLDEAFGVSYHDGTRWVYLNPGIYLNEMRRDFVKIVTRYNSSWRFGDGSWYGILIPNLRIILDRGW